MIRTMIWKEWMEQRHRCLVTVLTMVVYYFAVRMAAESRDEAEGFLLIGAIFISMLTPLYMAMGAFASERSGRTIDVLCAMPANSFMVAVVKIIVAAVATVIPTLIGWFLLYQFASASRGDDLLLMLGVFVAQSGLILVWAVSLGAGARSEGRVATIGVLALLASWAIAVLLDMSPYRALVLFFTPAAPLGWTTGDRTKESALIFIASQACMLTALLSWCAWRWRREPLWRWPRRRAQAMGHTSHHPIRSPIGALVWREYKESLPISAAIVLILMGFVTLVVITQVPHINTDSISLIILLANLPDVLAMGLAFIIGPMTVFVAVNVAASDLEPKLYDFWLARPIGTSRWFIARFVGGASAWIGAILAVCGGTMAAKWIAWSFFVAPMQHDFHVGRSPDDLINIVLAILMFGLPLLLAIYALSFWLGCFIRRTVMAGIAGLAILLLLWVLPYSFKLESLVVEELMEASAHRNLSGAYLGFAATYLCIAAVGIALAWQTIRRDWTWEKLVTMGGR
jgi:hypothetical protein